jgi:hypothetical protein
MHAPRSAACRGGRDRGSRPSAVCRNPGPGLELDGAADVVQQGGGEQQVGAQPRMELTELATDGRDTDRVLEQPAGVGVVPIRCRRQSPEPSPDLIVAEDRSDESSAARRGRFSPARNSRKPSSSSGSRRIAGANRAGSSSGGGLDRADVELQPGRGSARPARARALRRPREPRVEQLDVVPDRALDAAARVDELQREVAEPVLVRRRRLRATA